MFDVFPPNVPGRQNRNTAKELHEYRIFFISLTNMSADNRVRSRLVLIIRSFMLAAIGRTLIPRYFRSIFEGGVTELYYNLKHPKESFHNTSITLDCDNCVMVTHHGKPMFTKVRILSFNQSVIDTSRLSFKFNE